MADIYGTEFDDVLVGTDDSDEIHGLQGNDRLEGGEGDDFLLGGAGNNTYIGGKGNDYISLNYNVENGQDLDAADDGENILVFSPGDGEDEVVDFDVTRDKINLLGFGFESFADVENQIFEGADRFYLGIEDPDNPGDFSLIVQLVTIDGMPLTADNFLFGDIDVDPEPEPEDQTITGTEDADTLIADDGDDTISGLGGDDFIDGRGGDDLIFGGAGDDVIDGGLGADTIDGGEGIDTLDFSNRDGDSVVVNLETGENTDGDILSNIENITGTHDSDRLTGDDHDNVLNGLDGHDRLVGNGGNDTLRGGSGTDTLIGGAGADILDGGSGLHDNANYYHSSEGIRIDLVNGTGQGGDAEGDTLIDIESITGSQFADVLIGSDNDDTFSSWHGDDQMFGGDGDDYLGSRGGNNLFVGGDGNDRLVGSTTDEATNTFVFSAGDDADSIAFFDASSDVIDLSSYEGLTYEQISAALSVEDGDVVIDLGNAVTGGEDGDQITLDNFDVSLLSEDNFAFAEPEGVTLTGTNGKDQLEGTQYDDVLDGLRGRDTLVGGAGDDEIFGRQGHDTLHGGDGDDIIHAGRGKDTMFGDAGNDQIHFGKGSDIATGGQGDDQFFFTKGNRKDVITDFSDGDTITLTGFNGINSFDDVLANSVQTEDGVEITFGRDQLTLLDVDIDYLDANDFYI